MEAETEKESEAERQKKAEFKKKRAAHYNEFKMIMQTRNNKWESDSDNDWFILSYFVSITFFFKFQQ
jgi:hypothetical protein